MTVPAEYQRARDHLYAFLEDARDTAGLGSTHQAYTMVQGVLQAFRRRLDVRDGIRFAGVLPLGLRALFVADWDPAPRGRTPTRRGPGVPPAAGRRLLVPQVP